MGTDVNNNSLDTSFIPIGWEARQLDSISKIVDSLHQTPNFSDDGYSMVRVSDIKSGKLNLSGTLKVSEKLYRDFTKNHQPKKGDIVLSRVGSYGVSSFVATEEPFCLGQNTVVLEPHIENEFLYYSLNTQHVQQQIEFQSYGTGYKSLSLKNIKELILIIPKSKSEQSAITTTLSDTDLLIENLERLIEKKRNIKIGVMQEMLKPKENWEKNKLGEIAFFNKGRGLSKGDLIEDGEFKCIHYGELFTKYNEYIKSVKSRTNIKEKSFLSLSNDVLMPTSDVTPNGLATASCIKEDGIILGGDILVIRLIEGTVDGVYLSYFITNHREKVMKLVTGTTVYHLYASDMKDLEVTYPSYSEQEQICTILNDIEVEIEHLEQKLNKYKMIKQGMMQVLLTGKIRLL